MTDPRNDFLVDITEPVFMAVGEASACWGNLSGAGVFDSTHAKEVADGLIERLMQAFDKHAEATR